MIKSAKLIITAICIVAIPLMAQTGKKKTCPRLLTNSSMVINIEGKFVNEEKNRTSVSIEWRHHSEALDTFFVTPYEKPKFTYITAGRYRYMEIGKEKLKRQLGLHHLRESIGNTPLRLDDLELLANGYFKCPDSLRQDQNPNVLATANSMTWWSLVLDSLALPEKAVMHGAFKKSRYFTISKWRSYAGETLPTLVNVASDNYGGIIWIRSAYPAQALAVDPIFKKKKPKMLLPEPKSFGRITVEGERKIPLILKLNEELLSK